MPGCSHAPCYMLHATCWSLSSLLSLSLYRAGSSGEARAAIANLYVTTRAMRAVAHYFSASRSSVNNPSSGVPSLTTPSSLPKSIDPNDSVLKASSRNVGIGRAALMAPLLAAACCLLARSAHQPLSFCIALSGFLGDSSPFVLHIVLPVAASPVGIGGIPRLARARAASLSNPGGADARRPCMAKLRELFCCSCCGSRASSVQRSIDSMWLSSSSAGGGSGTVGGLNVEGEIFAVEGEPGTGGRPVMLLALGAGRSRSIVTSSPNDRTASRVIGAINVLLSSFKILSPMRRPASAAADPERIASMRCSWSVSTSPAAPLRMEHVTNDTGAGGWPRVLDTATGGLGVAHTAESAGGAEGVRE
mmetsp:Transcript_11419/g.29275  ORF Transcript_11419/g.29275 Transcript_11419/m.29275 type:complete len:362 (+) Transcript_11419:341-1426(+)